MNQLNLNTRHGMNRTKVLYVQTEIQDGGQGGGGGGIKALLRLTHNPHLILHT